MPRCCWKDIRGAYVGLLARSTQRLLEAGPLSVIFLLANSSESIVTHLVLVSQDEEARLELTSCSPIYPGDVN